MGVARPSRVQTVVGWASRPSISCPNCCGMGVPPVHPVLKGVNKLPSLNFITPETVSKHRFIKIFLQILNSLFKSHFSPRNLLAVLRSYQQLSKHTETQKVSIMKLFTSSSKISLALLGAIASASTFATTTLSNIKPAVAAQFCQCPIYVNNRFQLQQPYVWSAKDYGSVLARNGFTQVGSPQPGAVVVMQPSFPGTNRTHGHIGVVENVNGNGTIGVRGSNQGNRGLFGEAGCNNVNVTSFGTSVNGRRDVSFWVRGNNSNPGQQQQVQHQQMQQNGFRQANFSAWVMSSNGITLRNSPRLGDRSNQGVRFRQNLNFDGWTYGETVNDLQLGNPDARWYKIAGTNLWVPSAYVNGNAPNSRPMP
jgi:surface antigen